jgi:hypothetical protein
VRIQPDAVLRNTVEARNVSSRKAPVKRLSVASGKQLAVSFDTTGNSAYGDRRHGELSFSFEEVPIRFGPLSRDTVASQLRSASSHGGPPIYD